MKVVILLAGSLLWPNVRVDQWWYYDTGRQACSLGASPAEMVKFIKDLGHTPRLRYDGKRILVMKNETDTQGLIFYKNKTDCEEDGRT